MVAVAADVSADVGLGPVGEEEVVAVGLFAAFPAVGELVHDEDAHPVAELEEPGGGWVVGGAEGVHAHFLEDF